MTREQHLKLLEGKMKANLELARKKNSDYCGKSEDSDPFSNFRLSEVFTKGRVSTADGIFTRLCDKVARIGTLLGQDPSVAEESLQDACSDLSNYALILSNYLDSKKEVKPHASFIGIGDDVRITDMNHEYYFRTGNVEDAHESELTGQAEIVVNIAGNRHIFSREQLCKI